MYNYDKRIVMTLDAGGTNFVFSAIQGNEEIVKPINYPSNAANLDKCLQTLVDGFEAVMTQLTEKPVAISFAFPGPADYPNGIIGDLTNFPSFRGGIALGPFLKEKFDMPVYINNDGDLYAYGEALAGVLPELNKKLEDAGSPKRYKNLIGITFGTGFGAGIAVDGKLHMGDNAAGGEIWCFRNKKFSSCIAEESVSIRAVKRVYAERSGDDSDLTPKDIFDIAEGTREGNKAAAIGAFEELGEIAGDAIAQAVTLIDGIVAIGGGLVGAGKYIVPALVRELNSSISLLNGNTFTRLPMKAFNLDSDAEFDAFKDGCVKMVNIPGTDKQVEYHAEKRFGVATTKLGASKAIALGAYAYALSQLGE